MTDERVVRILYTNYRGETALRSVLPERIHFGSTEWHQEQQWLLEAFDLEKKEARTFALRDIRAWLAP